MSNPTTLLGLDTEVTVSIIKDTSGKAVLSAAAKDLTPEKIGVMTKVIGQDYDTVIDNTGNLIGPATAGGSSSHSSRGGKSRRNRKSRGGKSRKGRKSLRRK